jgi:hypothetical protein
MSSASVLQQFVARASDRASTGAALAEQFSPEDTIQFGEFRINSRNRTVALCGQNFELTSEEFDVLVFPDKPSTSSDYPTYAFDNKLDNQPSTANRISQSFAVASQKT